MHPDWLRVDWPAPSGVHALCTTRAGGVSVGPFAHLNLGDHVGDDPGRVAINRQRLGSALDTHTPGTRPVFLKQVHGTQVLTLQSDMADGMQADACISTTAALACTVLVADCLPVLLTHRHIPIVAGAHAGWRGLAGIDDGIGVLERTFHQFSTLALNQRRTSTLPYEAATAMSVIAAETIAWLGPCIGAQAFEVGSEVYAAFCPTNSADSAAAQCFKPASAAGHYYADLAQLARQRLAALGIHAVYGNDSSRAWCTVSNPSRFFSHRWGSAHAGGSGRLAACVWLSAAA